MGSQNGPEDPFGMDASRVKQYIRSKPIRWGFKFSAFVIQLLVTLRNFFYTREKALRKKNTGCALMSCSTYFEKAIW